jgi:phosphatidylethanolamine N-methyltransferase
MVEDKDPETRNILYDLKTGYFRKDLIVFKNLDPFRSSDLFIMVIAFYCLMLNVLNLHWGFYLGYDLQLYVINLCSQAIAWRLVHSFGLGFILYLQSKDHYWTNHFLKNGFTKQFAFEQWKAYETL